MNSRSDMPTAALLPLLADRDLSAPLAWRGGRPVSGHRYLRDVLGLARQLPSQGQVLNLCGDRYAFAVGLGAALSRGHASLLPPDARPDTLARLATPGGSTYVVTDDARLRAPGLHCHLIDLPLEDESPSQECQAVPGILADMHAVSLLTSGSTGVPQAHAKRWETLVGDVAAAAPRLSALLDRPSLAGLTLVATVPVQHSYGLESSALLAMLAGAAFDAARPFFPADIVAALESVPRPRALVTTPFHLKTLLLSGIALPQVDFMLSATAPLSPQLAAQAEQALGGPLIEIYGSTETGQIATRHTTRSEVWEMLGDIRVRREDFSDADGVTERYVVEGDFVPAATPMADVLELIDDQRFRLLGRANDLIHVAGRRSSLGHLNYHLNSIPGVQDGAFWIPDEVTDGVVRPVAFVVAPELSAESIIGALRERLEPVFVPRRVLRVKALPREATGKLTVRTLREFALAQLAGEGESVRLTREVPDDHPAFAGHFPGQPLLPGAFILSEVMEALSQVPSLASRLGDHPTLASAKFLAPVGPGAELTISLVPESGAAPGVRFEVFRGDVLAASGRWTRGAEPSP